ncbi:MAG: proline racemase family protein [Planctomycetes bacterium]|nr:proline racemase family protein [Planctomycetota bacterium]
MTARITTIDAHTAGEPLRVITRGLPEIPGETILERRRWAEENLESLRRALMLEPRGHADMYGCILMPPATSDGDLGVLFLHNEGYSTMCGHGIIGLVKVGVEEGLFELDPEDPRVRIDTPAGRVTATAHLEEERVARVSFENVPSFLLHRDVVVETPTLGEVRFDIGYGGAFYAYVDAKSLGLELTPSSFARIVSMGKEIKQAVSEAVELVHPAGEDDLNFLYGTIFVGPAEGSAHSRNVCVFADGEVDRSPTGTGVSGRAAVHHARGELGLGERITIESILGTSFDVELIGTREVGALEGVIPRVTGSAHITGRHEFEISPEDPLAAGFLLR